MLIDVKYTRDWQLGLKKNLQDSAVKPIIFTTQKRKFSVKETFAVSLQNRKSCVCVKYLILVRPRKLIAVNFTFLYSM